MGEDPHRRISAAREFDGGSFRISYEWKEIVVYWEGDQGFEFDAAWGVAPGELYVPDATHWDAVVPQWLVGRRDEVVGRLVQHSAHTVKDTDSGYRSDDPWRLRSR
jgi:hypothetical protein